MDHRYKGAIARAYYDLVDQVQLWQRVAAWLGFY